MAKDKPNKCKRHDWEYGETCTHCGTTERACKRDGCFEWQTVDIKGKVIDTYKV